MSWKHRFPPVVIVSGMAIGVIAAVLVKLGNPGNMGLCVACFERDIAGSLGLHRVAPVQYMRPEILGIVVGAFIAALFRKESVPRSGSSPAVRFVLGSLVMIGALVFLGCPTRMALRLGGGDANAVLGLAGFASGIALGLVLLSRGATLGRARRETVGVTRWLMPILAVAGIALVLVSPSFIFESKLGPGSMRAPVAISIVAGLVVGILGQLSRLCFAGGIRDMMLFRSPHLLVGFIGVSLGALLTNTVLGQFSAGFSGQPVAHSAHLWNFLGMGLVGVGSVMLGGCPFRQLIMASQGNGDSAMTVLGMVVGAAIAHNFGLAATPAGVPVAAMIAVGVGLATCIVVGLIARES